MFGCENDCGMFGCENDCGICPAKVGTLAGQMSVEISLWPMSAYLIEHSACHVPLFGNLPVHSYTILADKNFPTVLQCSHII